jgi:hypothetical protein
LVAKFFSAVGKVLRAAWIFLGVCILTVVLAEVAARIGYKVVDSASLAIHHRKPPERTPCERVMASLTLRWEPYTYWRGVPSHNDLVTVDPDGRRHTWRATGADPADPRVMMTGGSAVWGMCVRDDETIPSQLARSLDGAGTRARVENHAQIGWVTTQSLIDLMLDLRAGRVPRVAVFYDGWNDIVAGMAEGAPGIPLNEMNREREFNLLTHLERMRLYSIGNPMNSAMGRFATTLRRRLLHVTATAPANAGWQRSFGSDTSAALMDSVAREVVRVYEWNVATVEDLGKTYGFVPLFYWQPDVVGKTTLSVTEKATLAQNPMMERFTGRVRRFVRESPSLSPRADFRDLEAEFDGDPEEVFYDWCHVSASANQHVADLIASDVARELRRAAAVPAPGAAARPR